MLIIIIIIIIIKVRGQSTGPIVDAKIDSSKRQVIMASPSRSAHQSVMVLS